MNVQSDAWLPYPENVPSEPLLFLVTFPLYEGGGLIVGEARYYTDDDTWWSYCYDEEVHPVAYCHMPAPYRTKESEER